MADAEVSVVEFEPQATAPKASTAPATPMAKARSALIGKVPFSKGKANLIKISHT
ncbi:hypothetical protein Ssi02_29300 [Sinosporangium siamense]|uniref:Uncharacterized protein n=1 Tax=Sinosporangium siamense TaxID=1367973 RepID=A0A919RHX3_9ACTN|nr:hypothetical protein Ssi02_29300 [Sinosporangium siamense]